MGNCSGMTRIRIEDFFTFINMMLNISRPDGSLCFSTEGLRGIFSLPPHLCTLGIFFRFNYRCHLTRAVLFFRANGDQKWYKSVQIEEKQCTLFLF